MFRYARLVKFFFFYVYICAPLAGKIGNAIKFCYPESYCPFSGCSWPFDCRPCTCIHLCCVICNLCEMRCRNIKTLQSFQFHIAALCRTHSPHHKPVCVFDLRERERESLSNAQWLSWSRWENIALNFIWGCP